ncbi:MAG: phosphatidate cytidylyltransferase [Bacteroidales bacterium]|nr:phosphatidate cytidylyltransferase [Bacteroidales bacterium]
MNNFVSRTLSGIVFVGLIIGSIWYSPVSFAIVLFVVNFLGVMELQTLMNHSASLTKETRIINLFSSVLLYLALAAVALEWLDIIWLIPASLLLMLPFLTALFSRHDSFMQVTSNAWSSFFFISLPSGLLLFFFNHNIVGTQAGPLLVIVLLVMIWANDVFAYLIGSWLGRHRLFERISPKKSWEGAIGGLVMTLLLTMAFHYFTHFMPLSRLLIMALIVVITAILGDLTESLIKRQAGMKDSGSLIPGHGGILDRFDATFHATPFVFVYLMIS